MKIRKNIWQGIFSPGNGDAPVKVLSPWNLHDLQKTTPCTAIGSLMGLMGGTSCLGGVVASISISGWSWAELKDPIIKTTHIWKATSLLIKGTEKKAISHSLLYSTKRTCWHGLSSAWIYSGFLTRFSPVFVSRSGFLMEVNFGEENRVWAGDWCVWGVGIWFISLLTDENSWGEVKLVKWWVGCTCTRWGNL